MDLRTAEERLWAAVGLTPVEHRLDLPRLGIEVRVTEVGEGRPAVFVHGATVAGASWADLVPALSGVRCLLVDRPGCGRSERLREPDTIEGFLAGADHLVVDVLDALELESAAVVATSLGGFHGVRAAATHPDRVDRLALIGWVLGTPDTQPPMWMRLSSWKPAARLGARMPASKRSVKSLLRIAGLRRAIDDGYFKDEAYDWLVALYRQTDTMFNETASGPPLMSVRSGWNDWVIHDQATLSAVTAPTCIVYGEGDPFGTVEAARALGERLDAEFHLVAQAEHAPWLEATDDVAGILNGFLT